MNAPFDFGSGGRDRGLPTVVAGDRRDRGLGSGRAIALAAEPAAVESDGPKLQDQFFKYLGLALKHRWLILACCVAGHRSHEPGATAALDHLGLAPLLDLGMRLGEGSGACLALPVVEAAARLLREMATFDSAGVSEK